MNDSTSPGKTPLELVDPWPTVSTGPTMSIDEAIQHLSAATHTRTCRLGLSEGAALNLGIQALWRLREMRLSPCTTADEILPGETQVEPPPG